MIPQPITIRSIRLTPHSSFPATASFKERVQTLQRPYVKISREDMLRLGRYPEDIFTDGKTLYTYGDADGGHALMPVLYQRLCELDSYRPPL